MFTGLVEEKGKLIIKTAAGLGYNLTFQASKVMDDLEIGSSVSVNGCCLTVVNKEKNSFSVDVIEETLKKTNLGKLEINNEVNLERPLRTDERLGGHFVLGHVDTTGLVTKIEELTNSHFVRISFSEEFARYLIYVGSVAIDGVSMTVAELKNNEFGVGVIPHTWEETIFSNLRPGDKVNLEFDVLGKYVERIMQTRDSGSASE